MTLLSDTATVFLLKARITNTFMLIAILLTVGVLLAFARVGRADVVASHTITRETFFATADARSHSIRADRVG